MQTTRRQALSNLAALGGAALTDSLAQTPPANLPQARPQHAPSADARLQVRMLVHPDMTALDMVGPQLVFATMGNVDTHLVWKDLAPVTTDSGLKILPTMRFADAPAQPDILFVPGGLKGTTALLKYAAP